MEKETWLDRYKLYVGRIENNDLVLQFIKLELERTREEMRKECIEMLYRVPTEDDFFF